MKKLLLSGAILGLLCLTACSSSQSSSNNNTYNSGSSPTPTATAKIMTTSTNLNTASTAPTATGGVNTVGSANTANTATDEYKDVEDAACRLYLGTLKTLATCESITDAQRKQYSATYAESLKAFEADIPNAEARKARATGCAITNNVIQPLAAKCKG
ncbi:MAG: hypothetical protein ACR2N3_01880 [Pyrinomonadaceae bacterium]